MRYGWSARLAGFVPAGLVAACLATPPAADDPRPTGAAAPGIGTERASIDWSQGDCVGQLRSLQQAASEGRLTPGDRPPFAVEVVPAAGTWLDAVPELPLEADLPLALDDAAGARCVIRIGPPRDQSEAHRAVDVEDVRSAYQSGQRRERNPEYDLAQLKQREVKEDAAGRDRVVTVGDPLLDLIGTTVGGVIGTLDRHVRDHEVDAAAAELAATPRSIDRPVYRPYSFERVVVRAQKQAVVPVALLDAGGRQLRATELRQRERRELYVLQGLDARDRDYEQHRSTSMTRADLARWARTPPALRLSTVVTALAEGPTAPGIAPAAGPAIPDADDWPLEEPAPDALQAALPATAGVALEEGWLDDAPPDDDPAGDLAEVGAGEPEDGAHAASVVAIRAGDAIGHGFYVRRDLVLTAYPLVRAVSVVDVTTADGATVPALVAGVDAARGLALLQVPRPGAAVTLHEGGASAAGPVAGAVGQPGRPVFADDQVVGMSTGVAGRVVPIDAIHAFLDSQAAVLAAVP